jgi:hypothetical protein
MFNPQPVEQKPQTDFGTVSGNLPTGSDPKPIGLVARFKRSVNSPVLW